MVTRRHRRSAYPTARVYAPKNPRPHSIVLTSLGEAILAAANARTGAGASNVVEHLLRLHGPQVTAEAFRPLPDEDGAAA